jgi:hypothetical protein
MTLALDAVQASGSSPSTNHPFFEYSIYSFLSSANKVGLWQKKRYNRLSQRMKKGCLR